MVFEAPEIEISSNAGDPSDIRNITGAVSLPTGAATAARQDSQTTLLTNIDNKTPSLASGRVPVDGSGVTQPISAASLPLPTGAATAALQTSGNASLTSIDSKLSNLTNNSQTTKLVDGAGNELQSFDLDNTAGTSKILGVTVRALSNGTPVELGNASNPFRVDPTGTTTQPISAATLPLPTGAATSALQTSELATLNSIDGKINTATVPPSSSASGIVVRPVTIEYPTFALVATAIAVGNNKSMLAIQNTGTGVVRIREIWIINDQTTAVTGVAGLFEVRRIASFTAGTVVTPVAYDTADTLPAGISAATGATVATETSLLRQGVWSTDEWGPGTADTESFDHSIQNVTPFFSQPPNGKALTIRQNQGVHIKFATNSTAGAFNLRIIFTTE